MADIDVSLGINDTQARRALDSMGKSVDGLRGKFLSLESITGGLVLGNLIRDTYKLADANMFASDSYTAAARAQGNLATGYQNFQSAILDALEPLNNFIADINLSKNSIQEFGKTLSDLAANIITGGLGVALAAFIVALKGITIYGVSAAAVIGILGTSLAAALAPLLPLAAGAAALIALTMWLRSIRLKKEEIEKEKEELARLAARAATGEQPYTMERSQLQALSEEATATMPPGAADQVKAEIAKLNRMRALRQEFARFRLDQQLSLQDTSRDLVLRTNRLTMENRLLYTAGKLTGISEDSLEIERLKANLYDEQTTKVNALRDQIDRLRQLQQFAFESRDTERAQMYGQQIGVVQSQIKNLNDGYKLFIPTQIELTLETQKIRALEADRVRTLENMVTQIDAVRSRSETLGNTLRDVGAQMREAGFARETMTMGPFAQSVAQSIEATRRASMDAQQAFAAGFEDSGDGLTPERATELAQGLDRIREAFGRLSAAQTSNLQLARQWSTGWETAVNEYIENATDGAKNARESFDIVFSGIERGLDSMIQSGKWKFKDFVGSIIKDLTSMALRNAFRNLMVAQQGSGGFLSAIGSMFGSQAAFAGVFADGGYIPPGKFGIAGEAGPEVISGPAQVTPMGAGGGQTVHNHYYNINAVDSKSVAQLFAENRKTLLGIVTQAEKELPVRGRIRSN